MIFYIVLLNLKPETTEEEINIVLERTKALQQKIPGITYVHAGANKNDTKHQGYTSGFVMGFVDDTHLLAYDSHPEHQLVSKELRRISSSILYFALPED